MLLAEAMSEKYLLFRQSVLIAGCVSQAFYSKEKMIVSRSLDYIDMGDYRSFFISHLKIS